MDLNRVSAFVRVVQDGSFTAAARALGLPKSSISRSVAQLEHDLGDPSPPPHDAADPSDGRRRRIFRARLSRARRHRGGDDRRLRHPVGAERRGPHHGTGRHRHLVARVDHRAVRAEAPAHPRRGLAHGACGRSRRRGLRPRRARGPAAGLVAHRSSCRRAAVGRLCVAEVPRSPWRAEGAEGPRRSRLRPLPLDERHRDVGAPRTPTVPSLRSTSRASSRATTCPSCARRCSPARGIGVLPTFLCGARRGDGQARPRAP